MNHIEIRANCPEAPFPPRNTRGFQTKNPCQSMSLSETPPAGYKSYDSVPTSLVTNLMYFPGYFQVKAMKSQVNVALN